MSDLTITAIIVTMPSVAVWQAVTVPSPDSGYAPYIAQIVTAAVPALIAWFAYRSSQRAGAKTDSVIAKQEATDAKVDAVAEKTTKIGVATDGTLHTMTKSLEVANTEIKGLKDLIAQMVADKKDAKDLKEKQDVKDAEEKKS